MTFNDFQFSSVMFLRVLFRSMAFLSVVCVFQDRGERRPQQHTAGLLQWGSVPVAAPQPFLLDRPQGGLHRGAQQGHLLPQQVSYWGTTTTTSELRGHYYHNRWVPGTNTTTGELWGHYNHNRWVMGALLPQQVSYGGTNSTTGELRGHLLPQYVSYGSTNTTTGELLEHMPPQQVSYSVT